MYSSSFSRSLFKLYLDRTYFALHPVSDTKVRFFIHARLPITSRLCSLVIFDVHRFSLVMCRTELRREKSVTSPIKWVGKVMQAQEVIVVGVQIHRCNCNCIHTCCMYHPSFYPPIVVHIHTHNWGPDKCAYICILRGVTVGMKEV